MQFVLIRNQSHPKQKPIKANYCTSFFGRLRGLMFQKSLGMHDGLLMVQPHVNRMDSAIHMLFMRFDIAVIWVDNDLKVVDAQYARKWRLAYVPSKGAKYVLEIRPDRLKDYKAGDQLVFEKC